MEGKFVNNYAQLFNTRCENVQLFSMKSEVKTFEVKIRIRLAY